MVETQNQSSPSCDPPEPQPQPQAQPLSDDPVVPPTPSDPTTPHTQTGFNPSRMIGIIRRKAMIKDLAGIYHAECLTYCRELLELQKKAEESLIEIRIAEASRRETMRPPKHMKKAR
ncbi:uncharacterized protein LOC107838920 isoform X2 [Capsicum annuum]|uniref:uncharacterized protein LOC107838920 isoform X2 n=1 Tax=Capsicum annuum TaxID=4072 RepID=UPI0007BF1288|nr:uncharacterized protein LOC107838920 isoform X2 [Capsicum annuum]XP_047251669.1 uncharacterized protein LOC107838920 isoform X2 [Capsicum annuum]XP_047251670.1 uncharacterized protein LOC107838920 isoform X2 [Capsicum annuum]XP_047251671.1 uncharacterized protein LOC107838920 isoform X2 [Capsicum annuum]XP_047251672.1 uncharacterized protein LOC107838920 isoform X2 [Capsicum annuum]